MPNLFVASQAPRSDAPLGRLTAGPASDASISGIFSRRRTSMLALLLLLAGSPAWGESRTPSKIASDIRAAETANSNVKVGAESRVELYKPSADKKTPLVFLYLHGFSASPVESKPLTEDLGEKWKSHAYLPRLSGHGLAEDALVGVSLEQWDKDVDSAFATALELGEKVVVLSMSNGSSLAAPWIAANQDKVAAAVFLSPHFKPADWKAELLRWPMGKWFGELFLGPRRAWEPKNAEQKFFWTTNYPTEALIPLMKAAAKAREVDFTKWNVPTFLAYHPEDPLINISWALGAMEKIPARKEVLSVPEAEDTHIIAGDIMAPKGTAIILDAVDKFLGAGK
jgi:esterase/lipase